MILSFLHVSIPSPQVANVLAERSLEVSFASALSVVSSDGYAADTSSSRDSHEALRSQVLDYFSALDLSPAHSQLSPSNSNSQSQGTPRRMSFNVLSSSGSAFDQPPRRISLEDGRRGSRSFDHSTSIRLREQAAAAMGAALSDSNGGQLVLGGDELLTWEMDMTDMSQEQLCKVAFNIFMASGVVEALHIAASTVMGFVTAVASHYRSNPYHNFCHVVHVLQAVLLIVRQGGARHVFSDLELLALLVAALCHDLEHDGRSNAFHIATQSEIAQRYNDISVLENHHCALVFELLRRSNCNLFAGFSNDVYMRLRRLIIGGVLATDLANHGNVLRDCIKLGGCLDPSNPTTVSVMFNAILHAADLSNHLRPFDISKAWSGW